ncbi:MAG TPA: ABC-F family ATP-binding cassette domain-containing protein [Candidatus Saccharimonadia bacterium]|nr:ABC-F family ATP-binding cassette domain-containing protein [Candidatus Saccharimonadia bacterium]
MLALHAVTKEYDGLAVLDNVELTLKPGDVVGLIGANGAGKSTLLQIAAGVVEPGRGTVTTDGEAVGYLPQRQPDAHLRVEAYLTNLLPWPDEAYRLEIALAKVGLGYELKSRWLDELSGGQKTRVGLAGLLLSNPSVLLLDEPTNNLDSDSLDWLIGFIRRFEGAALMASHDRRVLDLVTTQVVELAHGRLAHYGGNYSFYLDQKAIERAAQAVKYQTYRTEQKQLKQAIAQKRAMADKAGRASAPDNEKMITHYLQDKVSRLYHKDAKTMTKRLERLPEVQRPAPDRTYTVTVSGQTAAAKLIVAAENLAFAYNGHEVIEDVSFEIRGSQRLGILGANGAGKSTLLKLVAGQLQPSRGQVRLGQGVRLGYYSQEATEVMLGTGLDYLRTSGASVQACYDMALSLRLSPGAVRQLCSQLSYGGLAKLRFAALLLQPVDLLVLDEPTNHLEIGVRHDLEAGLQQYGGAIVVASHDAYFLERIGLTDALTLKSGG